MKLFNFYVNKNAQIKRRVSRLIINYKYYATE